MREAAGDDAVVVFGETRVSLEDEVVGLCDGVPNGSAAQEHPDQSRVHNHLIGRVVSVSVSVVASVEREGKREKGDRGSVYVKCD